MRQADQEILLRLEEPRQEKCCCVKYVCVCERDTVVNFERSHLTRFTNQRVGPRAEQTQDDVKLELCHIKKHARSQASQASSVDLNKLMVTITIPKIKRYGIRGMVL